MAVTIGIDRGADDQTVYTIPHKEAFLMLEREVVRQHHGSGSFDTQTALRVDGDTAVFTVTVKKTNTKKEPKM